MRIALIALALVSSFGACAVSHGENTAENGGVGGAHAGGTGGQNVAGEGGWPDGGGGAPSGGGTTSSGGTGGCTPQCAGKQCGSDGCGKDCGPCTAGQSCNAQYQCVSSCPPSWQVDIPATAVSALAYDGSAAFVVGHKNDQAWAGKVDACLGSLVTQQALTPSGATSSSLNDVVLSGGSLFALGSVATSADPGDGLFAKLETVNLTASFENPLWGGAKADEGWKLAATPGGFWMVGASDTTDGGYPWAIKGSSAGAACGFALDSQTGAAHAVAANGGTVYVMRSSGANLWVETFSDAACSSGPTCACTPNATWGPFNVGQSATDARAAVAVGSDLYLGGLAWDSVSTDGFGFVLHIGPSGNVLGTYKWNPTALFDGIVSLNSDGSTLYVGGAQGWDSTQSTLDTATASLQALPLGFTGTAPAPSWTHSFASLDVVWGIATDGSGGLIAAGQAQTASFVLRCLKNGTCP